MDLFRKVALSFARAFIASIVVLIPGVLAAPSLSGARALGTAAVIAAITAGVRAIQHFFVDGGA